MADPERVDEAGIASYREEFIAAYNEHKPAEALSMLPRLIGRDAAQDKSRAPHAA